MVPLTHLLTYSLAYLLNHSLTYSLTHSPTHLVGITKKSKKSMKNIEEALAEQVVSKLPEPSSYYLYQEKLRSESQYSGLLGHTLALDKKFLLEYIPIPLHVKYETPGGGKEALLMRLNLGCEYQPIIQQFVTYAHEIRVIATDLFMKYKEKESNRRENARIRAQNALKRRQPSENMSRKVPCSLTHSLTR